LSLRSSPRRFAAVMTSSLAHLTAGHTTPIGGTDGTFDDVQDLGKRAAMKSRRAVTDSEPATTSPQALAALVVVRLVNGTLLDTVRTALKTNGEIQSRPFAFFFVPTLSHFEAASDAARYDFTRFFLNSLLLFIGAAASGLAIRVASGYAIIRLGRGRLKLLMITTAVIVILPITFALPFYMMFDRVGLVDTAPALIFAGILSDSAAPPVAVGVANFITSYGAAATVMSVMPPIILGFAAQRYFLPDLTTGGATG
jgi:ABC-type glycerol-3-phosphate transport system permease component